jgi:hypothetical protein
VFEGEAAGRLFRGAWVQGVRDHHPGDPKPGYVVPWEGMPDWERDSACAVAEQVARFVVASGGGTAGLTPDQRSQFVATCWIAQVHRHFASPKESYVTPWEKLNDWQRSTDAHIFDVIESQVLATSPRG